MDRFHEVSDLPRDRLRQVRLRQIHGGDLVRPSLQELIGLEGALVAVDVDLLPVILLTERDAATDESSAVYFTLGGAYAPKVVFMDAITSTGMGQPSTNQTLSKA